MSRGGSKIVAVVTDDRNLVDGGVPIFLVRDPEKRTKVATYLAKMLDGMVHDLENGVFVIVQH